MYSYEVKNKEKLNQIVQTRVFNSSKISFMQNLCHRMLLLMLIENSIIVIMRIIYINLHIFLLIYEAENDEKLKQLVKIIAFKPFKTKYELN
jgi:hypothetical protein